MKSRRPKSRRICAVNDLANKLTKFLINNLSSRSRQTYVLFGLFASERGRRREDSLGESGCLQRERASPPPPQPPSLRRPFISSAMEPGRSPYLCVCDKTEDFIRSFAQTHLPAESANKKSTFRWWQKLTFIDSLDSIRLFVHSSAAL